MGIYFLTWLTAISWLFVWVILCNKNLEKYKSKGPFAMRDPAEYHAKYGKRLPF